MQWVDQGLKDWVNNDVWLQIWGKEISNRLANEILKYSNMIKINQPNLKPFEKELKEFEKVIKEQIERYGHDPKIILKEIRFDLGNNQDDKYKKNYSKYYKEKVK